LGTEIFIGSPAVVFGGYFGAGLEYPFPVVARVANSSPQTLRNVPWHTKAILPIYGFSANCFMAGLLLKSPA
jgi:hypothetical protein